MIIFGNLMTYVWEYANSKYEKGVGIWFSMLYIFALSGTGLV